MSQSFGHRFIEKVKVFFGLFTLHIEKHISESTSFQNPKKHICQHQHYLFIYVMFKQTYVNCSEVFCFKKFRIIQIVYMNQSTVSTRKRLASLFWYLIASTIDTYIILSVGYEIACIWISKYNVHVWMIQTNADFLFQKLIVFVICWL